MTADEITQLIAEQTATIAQLQGNTETLKTRLAPVLAVTMSPEPTPIFPDPEDSPVSAALKQNNYNLFVADLYIRDIITRLEV